MSFFEEPRKPRNVFWAISSWLIGAGLVGGVLFVTVAPTPYLVEQPGPVYDVLGSINKDPMISISGKKTFDTEGSLDMLTVTLQGTAERGASWFYVGLAKFDQSKSILKIEDVYP
ncbi:MAG: ATP-dependent serine peptidase containing a PDZ domain protein, partial [Microbacteriaceae bacterium]|nr:ATP-dependent serine peptidase containing a PDZ domain protein [Microbacteriaceae bacterium]